MGDNSLRQVFMDYSSFGSGQSGSAEMDSATFVKLAKESNLVGSKISTTDLDLIFTKLKVGNKIDYDTFQEAVKQVAHKMDKSYDDVTQMIVSNDGPMTGNATVADDVRFHDDKSTFTGVHKNGGPTTVDASPVNAADQVDPFESADVRGVTQYQDGLGQPCQGEVRHEATGNSLT